MTSRRGLMIAATTAREDDRVAEELMDRDHLLEDSTSVVREETNVMLTKIAEGAATIGVEAEIQTVTEGVVGTGHTVKVGTTITTMDVFRVGEGDISPEIAPTTTDTGRIMQRRIINSIFININRPLTISGEPSRRKFRTNLRMIQLL